jgi:hypothetical protein
MFLDRLEARRSHGKPSIVHVPSGVRSAVELLGAECWLKFDSENSIVENRIGAPGITYVDPPWHRAVGQKGQTESLIHRENNRKRISSLYEGPSWGRIWESWGPTCTVFLQPYVCCSQIIFSLIVRSKCVASAQIDG